MVYVDLNPIRAGMTDRLDASAHTSVAGRIVQTKSDPTTATSLLKPVAGGLRPAIDITTAEHLQILIGPAVSSRPQRGRNTPHAPAILNTMDHDAKCWTTHVAAFGGGWFRVVGSAHGLIAMAERLGQQWLKGIRLALTLG
jgi:putative transposase